MNGFFEDICKPLDAIKFNPYHFWVWFGAAIILGSSGVWIPAMGSIIGGNTEGAKLILRNLIKTGNLASFSIVILSDGLAAALATVGAASNIKAAGIRGILGIIAFILMIFQVIILTCCQYGPIVPLFQIILTFLAILVACYFYCFRFPLLWEKGLDKIKKEQDEQVENLGKDAQSKTSTDEGVKL